MPIDAIVAGAGNMGMHGCEAADGGGVQGDGAREAAGCRWQYALRIRP